MFLIFHGRKIDFANTRLFWDRKKTWAFVVKRDWHFIVSMFGKTYPNLTTNHKTFMSLFILLSGLFEDYWWKVFLGILYTFSFQFWWPKALFYLFYVSFFCYSGSKNSSCSCKWPFGCLPRWTCNFELWHYQRRSHPWNHMEEKGKLIKNSTKLNV